MLEVRYVVLKSQDELLDSGWERNSDGNFHFFDFDSSSFVFPYFPKELLGLGVVKITKTDNHGWVYYVNSDERIDFYDDFYQVTDAMISKELSQDEYPELYI